MVSLVHLHGNGSLNYGINFLTKSFLVTDSNNLLFVNFSSLPLVSLTVLFFDRNCNSHTHQTLIAFLVLLILFAWSCFCRLL